MKGGYFMRIFDYSKYENYKWDSEILKKISSIYNNKGRLEVLLLQNSLTFNKLTESAKFESIVGSNTIEGIITTTHRFKQIINEKSTPKNRSEEEISGYRDTLNIINESYEYIEITSNYILQIHNILYKNVSGNSFGGKYKNVQNYISASNERGEMYTLFTPLDPFETPKAVEDICNEYNEAIKKGITNPLTLTFIFIQDFLSIHPFNDGNGRTSRLLTNLFLYKLGYFVGKYISLENKIADSKDSYYDALCDSQKDWHLGNNNPTPFINYMLGILAEAYDDLEEKIQMSNLNMSAYEIVKQSLSSKIGKITKSELVKMCPTLSTSSIEKSIKQLVGEGKLEKHGKGKNTFYVIKL